MKKKQSRFLMALHFNQLKKAKSNFYQTMYNCNVCVKLDRQLVHPILFQKHFDYFGGEHEVLSIQRYEQSPNKYKKVFCEPHEKEVLVKACEKCDKLICYDCDGSENCPGSYILQFLRLSSSNCISVISFLTQNI